MLRHILVAILSIHLSLLASAEARPVFGTKGMVSTAHPAATDAGVKMLRLGGNAADSAAAAAFALAVVEPYSSGIGGGGFALIKFGSELHFMDFRETAPAQARHDMYIEDGKPNPLLSRDGPLSVAVPGAVMGYLELQEKYGKLKRRDILKPAIKFATKGIRVDSRFQEYLNWRLEQLRADPESAKIFLVKDDKGNYTQVPKVGHIIKQKDLAWTLRQIEKYGAKAFYRGKVAKRLAKDMKNRGGILTLKDLKEYKVRYRKPLVGSFRGHAIASSPPPSSGGQIVLTILHALENISAKTDWRDPQTLHKYIEISKRAYADRALLGDPGFVPDITPDLIRKDRAKLLTQMIKPQAEPAINIPAGQGAQLPHDLNKKIADHIKESNDTTHLCTLDKEGNAVSMTTTINYGWGAALVAKGTGVVWNDEMDDFAVAPGTPNAYGIVGSTANAVMPGKVPLSSMSPTLVFAGPTTDSPLYMVVGSPGGSRIPSTVAQAIWHFIDHGADAERALGIGRVHHQHLPDTVFIEPFSLEPATRQVLESLGHRFTVKNPWSNATLIAVDPESKVRSAAADPRGVGTAAAE